MMPNADQLPKAADITPDRKGALTVSRPLALVLAGTLALGAMFSKQQISANTARAQGSTDPVALRAEAFSPQSLASQTSSMAASVAEAWSAHQLPDGNLLDPVEGRVGGYGLSMIGEAMVQTGVTDGNAALVHDGLQAELLEVSHPANGGFEELSLAQAYNWNQAHLASSPDWQAAQSTLAKFLETHKQPTVSSGASTCFAETYCWDNLKLVGAVADIELANTGLLGQSVVSSVQRRPILTNKVESLLKQAATNTGADADRLGSTMSFGEAGILSDPSRNPLAYHELSTMMLGHVIEELGSSETPAVIKAAFQRGARAIVGLMAPDGDVAYIGRGQGQVWNVAASADALAIAAHDTSNPVWRGRYLAGVARALTRLRTVYTPGSWGMPLVPRLAGDPNPNYEGIDSYANSVEYNGLALWELQDAAQELQNTASAPSEDLGADSDGVFIDPSHTEFAAVREGDLWWAIHAGDTSPDARYDFGLVAAEQQQKNGLWSPAMPYRPLTGSETSGGPVLILHGEHLVPVGNKITADAKGVVDVKGGWATRPEGKPLVDSQANWLFQQVGNDGVNLSFMAGGDNHRTYQFQVWYEVGSQVITSAKGINVSEPDGRHENYSFNKPVTVTSGPVYHSAYDENLGSSTITLKTKSKQRVSYTTEF